MAPAHSLLCGNVAEHATLLLIGSSHAHWTHHALLRSTIPGFFSSLLKTLCGLPLPVEQFWM